MKITASIALRMLRPGIIAGRNENPFQSGRQGSLRLGGVEAKSHPMDGLQVDLRVRFKVFSELGDEYVHASAQEIIVFPPDVQ